MKEEVILAGDPFDMPTDNYEEFDQQIDTSNLGKKLVQVNTLKGTIREYQFYAAHDLLLNFIEKKNAPEKKFRFNLAWVSPDPKHNKVIIWKWLFGALGAFTIACLCLYLAAKNIVPLEYCGVGGLVSVTLACISTLIFIYHMRDEYIFKSHFGGAELFLIENKRPNQTDFDSFFTGLQNTIDKAQSEISITDKLVGELKMCRRLKDEGIITEAQYTAARTIIFKHKQYKT